MAEAILPAIMGGLSINQGEKQMKAQREAMAAQKATEEQALARAQGQEKENEMMQRAANRRSPDRFSLLNRASQAAMQGVASTQSRASSMLGRMFNPSKLLGG